MSYKNWDKEKKAQYMREYRAKQKEKNKKKESKPKRKRKPIITNKPKNEDITFILEIIIKATHRRIISQADSIKAINILNLL